MTVMALKVLQCLISCTASSSPFSWRQHGSKQLRIKWTFWGHESLAAWSCYISATCCNPSSIFVSQNLRNPSWVSLKVRWHPISKTSLVRVQLVALQHVHAEASLLRADFLPLCCEVSCPGTVAGAQWDVGVQGLRQYTTRNSVQWGMQHACYTGTKTTGLNHTIQHHKKANTRWYLGTLRHGVFQISSSSPKCQLHESWGLASTHWAQEISRCQQPRICFEPEAPNGQTAKRTCFQTANQPHCQVRIGPTRQGMIVDLTLQEGHSLSVLALSHHSLQWLLIVIYIVYYLISLNANTMQSAAKL